MIKNKFFVSLKQYTSLCLIVLNIIGIVLIVTFLAPRSELENQFLFGLSARRFILASIFIFFWIVNTTGVLWHKLSLTCWGIKIENKANIWVPFLIVTLYLTAFISATVWLAMLHPVIRIFRFLLPFRDQLDHLLFWLFVSNSFLILWLKTKYKNLVHEKNVIYVVEQLITVSVVFVISFFLYSRFAMLIDWVNKSRHSFWDLLAEEFVQGRLYLTNPPLTHDLTLYKGHWYVPMPPLPAILMIPFVYFLGADKIDTIYFSILFSAVNSALVFLILKEINNYRWIQIPTWGIVLLSALFLFGTPHLWVGISGRGWFVSQILTVTFLALSIYSALKLRSPLLVGLFIAIAMMARPNSLMTWPFVAAISMQLIQENHGNVSWRQFIIWSMKTSIPIILAIIGLLIYNYLRFDNIFDFGYTTINGAADIVANAQTWGIFSTHFISRNLYVMFFEVPWINLSGYWPIEPSGAGMSIFLTTPALIYLFRYYPKKWWVVGAWVSIVFNVVLLSLYHNTGAHQFGYRYILDFLIPLITMLAVGFSNKIPWHFVLMVVLSIAINLYGANWFING